VNVWNLRFLTGTTHATAPGTISAKLEQKYDEKLKKRVLVGTVTNHAKVELTDVIVRMAEGTVKVREKLAPGETVEISSPIDVRDATFKVADNEQAPIYSSWQQGPNVPQEPPTTAKMADLAMMRSERVEKLLTQYRDTACVYARCSAAPETVKLALPEAKRVHEQVIRSLVHLERPPAFKVRVISATRAATRSSK
jgi:hypothetical protein